MTVRRLLAASLILAALLPAAALAARSDLGAPGKTYNFSINAYTWLNKYHTTVNGADVGNTLSDLATGTHASFMVVGTAHWRSWAFAVDGVFNSFDHTESSGESQTTLDISQVMIMPQIGYKLLDSRNPRDDTGQALWLNVGGRYWNNENRLGWTYTPSGSGTPEQGGINLDNSWWDALVGVSAHFKFTDFVHGYARGNVGGFGLSDSSDFTWDLSFVFAYHLSHTLGFHGGYQLISFERTTGEGFEEITTDQLTEGLFVGVSVVF